MSHFMNDVAQSTFRCCSLHDISFDKIETCAKSALGNSLLYGAGVLTHSLTPRVNWIPWLVIEDLNKPVAKDWSPPYNLSKKTTAYIEVKQTTNKTKYQEDSLFLFVCSTSTF